MGKLMAFDLSGVDYLLQGLLKFGPQYWCGDAGLAWGLGFPAFSGQPPNFVS